MEGLKLEKKVGFIYNELKTIINFPVNRKCVLKISKSIYEVFLKQFFKLAEVRHR